MRNTRTPVDTVELAAVPAKLADASRLEMRWAMMFTALKWNYRFRPWKVDGFEPTFILDFHRPIAVFVADALTEAELLTIGRAATRTKVWSEEILLLGATIPKPGTADGPLDDSIGQLGETDAPKGAPPQFGDAVMFRCSGCGGFGMCHGLLSYTCRVCGTWEGDHHLGTLFDNEIQTFWTVAGELSEKSRP